jgi:hypothetical protein
MATSGASDAEFLDVQCITESSLDTVHQYIHTSHESGDER